MQLPLFRNKYPCSCSGEAAEVRRRLQVWVRGSFKKVEVLIRILLVVPVSSCEAERNFSVLQVKDSAMGLYGSRQTEQYNHL